ncbi:MAG: hypothetical protein IT323_21465, partial [Anaerolineae bacterium]|nr:hypothetical protein [Anaerolineae bacterium]
RETLEQAFNFYDPIINAYARNGTRIILIVLQDTYWGNAPWANGDWQGYSAGFAERLGMIVRRYKGKVAAYQVWNEPDMVNAPTSINVAPDDYAVLLAELSNAVVLADPGALVLGAGMATGAGEVVEYLLAVRRKLGSELPVDGISCHPYGQTPPGEDSAPFEGWSLGSLDSYLQRITNAFPRLPIYITEIGVPRVDVNKQEYWPGIARYMDRTIDFIRSTYTYAVRAVTWFAWSDAMDNAGIVRADQQPKGAIYTSFFQNMHEDYPKFVSPAPSPFDGKITIVHNGDAVPDRSPGELAARIATAAPNVGGFLLRTSRGTSWAGGSGPGMTINWSGDLTPWAAALARYRMRLHAWHELSGRNPTSEIALIGQIIRAAGVASVVIDLNPAALALRNGQEIRDFMLALRRALPAGYPLGVSFDGRPETFASVNLIEWYPFFDTWHPKLFPAEFGGTAALQVYLQATYAAMRPYRKPILPMLPPSPAEQVFRAVRFATDNQGAPGISFGMLSRFAEGDLGTVRGQVIPWLSGQVPARNLGTLQVKATRAVSVRTTPSESAVVLDQLAPGARITVLERRTITPWEWVRHTKGWSAARNTGTGEVFLG